MRIIREQKQHRIKIVGSVRVGIKVQKDGKEYPRSLDYYLLDSGENPEIAKNALRAIGSEMPKVLHIVFISDDDEMNCDERYELIVKKRIYAYGDGERFYERGITDDTFILHQGAKAKDEILDRAMKIDSKVVWKEVVRLRFIIMEYREVFGLWQFTSHGARSTIREIVDTYHMVKEMTGGRIKGIPFDMTVKMVTGGKVGSTTKFPVVSMVANLSMDNLIKLEQLKQLGREVKGFITNDRMDEADIDPPAMIEENPYDKARRIISAAKTVTELKEAIKEVKSLSDAGFTEEQKAFLNDLANEAKKDILSKEINK